jgi:outer membrane protein OmpA-like peptidoglycan-associated protein/opacity protein-like surface antigen
MRTTAVALVLATTVLSSPAFAKDQAWYIGLELGPNLVQNQLFDIRNAAQTAVSQDGIRARHDIGYDVGGNIGYDFGKFRAEFEVAYMANSIDSMFVEQAVPAIPFGVPTLPATTVTASVPPLGTYDPAGGNARVLSFMGNGYYDIGGQGTDLGAYIGAGLGIARVQHASYALRDGGAAMIDDSDTGVAWQVLAGVYKPLSDHVELGLKYRFFNVDNVDTFTTNGLATQTRYRSHSLMVTLAYNFFEPVDCNCAPPPPPPPPPLPPCPPAAVTPGPFLVFFDWDKSLITADAAAILDRAAEQFAATGQANVALAGHADTSGAADYNMRLSQRRADAVKAYLAGKGVPEAAMVTEAFGETRLLVETADGVREPQNRRVEITFSGAPQPNMTNCTPQ